MRWMDLELCTRDIGCKNWPTRELVPSCKFSSWVSWSVKHRLVLHPNCRHKIRILFRTNWTVCMRWLDLELCTRDIGCKNWPTRELVPPCKFSSWVSWSVKHRLVLHPNCRHKIRILFRTNWTVCMRWLDLELCTRDIGCKNWPTRELVPPCKFSSWVSWSVKHRLVLHPNCRHKIRILFKNNWTDCMRWLDLELCTRDLGCKNWPTRELVPPCKFSSWVSWSVKHRLVLHPNCWHKIRIRFRTNWTDCMRWLDLELCTRDLGCKNWPTRELVPPCKFSSWVSWSVKHRLVLHPNCWHKIRIRFRTNWTDCMRWLDLELCTRDIGCKNWPIRELVPPCKFSSWVSWSVKHRLVLHPNCWYKIRILFRTNWTVCMRWMDLELCTRDIGCKNWPTRELVPPCKFSSWVSWSVKHRLVLHPNYISAQEKKKNLFLRLVWVLHGNCRNKIQDSFRNNWTVYMIIKLIWNDSSSVDSGTEKKN